MRELDRDERRELLKRLTHNELQELSHMCEAGMSTSSDSEAEAKYWEVVAYIRRHADGRS